MRVQALVAAACIAYAFSPASVTTTTTQVLEEPELYNEDAFVPTKIWAVAYDSTGDVVFEASRACRLIHQSST